MEDEDGVPGRSPKLGALLAGLAFVSALTGAWTWFYVSIEEPFACLRVAQAYTLVVLPSVGVGIVTVLAALVVALVSGRRIGPLLGAAALLGFGVGAAGYLAGVAEYLGDLDNATAWYTCRDTGGCACAP